VPRAEASDVPRAEAEIAEPPAEAEPETGDAEPASEESSSDEPDAAA
jgi:hypothetical protein